MKFSNEKLIKILSIVLIMVFSLAVLTRIIPESKYIQETLAHLEESQNTIMKFSGTTIGTSVALSALPNDFASPLAGTVSDLNTYFIFMFAVIFVEKLIVMIGTKISLAYIIPFACILYIASILTSKELFKKFATKLLILGISLVVVIPFSTHFTDKVCDEYLAYVDETIDEANAGSNKINEVMSSGAEDATFFDKISNAFKTAIQDVNDLLAYFKNVVRKCVNSVAIMLVTTFVLPMLMMLLFRWLLKELFSLHLPNIDLSNKLPLKKSKSIVTETDLKALEDKE